MSANTWEPPKLPFFDDPARELPSLQAIRACSNVLQEKPTYKVVAPNGEVVVKYGQGVDIEEGDNLLYLQRFVPAVPAPKLYAMYYDSDEVFLVLQRCPGVRLDSLWPTLSESEKDAVITELRCAFAALRSAECPDPNFFGGLDQKSSLRHYLLSSQKKDHDGYLGPFHCQNDFTHALTSNFRALVEHNNRADFKVRHYERHLATVLDNFRPTLTHGDLNKSNILVAETFNSKDSNGTDTRKFTITLLDWEKAGWWPDFWEYFCASSGFDFFYWEDDWCWRVEQFLEVWPANTAIMRQLDKDMRI